MNSKMTRNSSQQWKSKILKQNPWRSPAYWLAFHASLSLLSSTTQEHMDDMGHNGLGLSTWILPSRKCCHRFAHRPIWVRRFFIWDLRFLLPRYQTDKKKKKYPAHTFPLGGLDLIYVLRVAHFPGFTPRAKFLSMNLRLISDIKWECG